MQVKVKIKALKEAVVQASHTLDTKASSLGSYMHFIANEDAKMSIYSNDMSLSRTLLTIPATVVKKGETLILPNLLQSILFKLPEDEEIELGLNPSGARLQVKYGTIKSEIAVASDAPKVGTILSSLQLNAKSDITLSASTLVTLTDRLLFCTATGNNAIAEGPWLSSIYLETGNGSVMGIATNRIIAGTATITDGLATSGWSVAIHRRPLVALKALLSKRKLEEVTITNVPNKEGTSNEVLFRFSGVVLAVRLLSTPYPKTVRKIFSLPSGSNTCVIKRETLITAIDRLNGFAEKNIFSMGFGGEKITMYTRGFNSVFQEQIAHVEKGKTEMTIGLGIADVSNILSAMNSEDVSIHYTTTDKQVFFQEGDSDFKYVVSPADITWGKKGE